MKFMKSTCPTCGCEAVYKQEECGSDEVMDGLYCENCQEWIAKTIFNKMHYDKTRYKLIFSLQDVSERGKHEILSMCRGHLTQRQLAKENISITDSAEAVYGIIQRLKGFDAAYEVKPPYPYEVKAWDGYMDRDFLQELAKSNPGLDIEGILHDQDEDMKKWEE